MYKKYILLAWFLYLHCLVWGQVAYEYRYWFDEDTSTIQSWQSYLSSCHFDVDVSDLDNTFHTIHFQVMDKDSVWSVPLTRYFHKFPGKQLKFRYWFDEDVETMVQGTYNDGAMLVDVSSLIDGFHILHMQVEEGNVPSSSITRMFIKVPPTEGDINLKCLCTIDGKIYKQKLLPSKGGIVEWQLDVRELEQGLHTLQVQVLTPSGAATSMYKSFFLRTMSNKEYVSMKCYYSIDGSNTASKAGVYTDGAYHFDIDVDSIDDGIHNLTYFLSSADGTSTKVSNAFFYKIPLGGPGIIGYKYWINDDFADAEKVQLQEHLTSYQLISLLPVASQPIRSKCFHFEIEEDGTPMMYAKNEIHFYFEDVSGKIAEMHKHYIDQTVYKEVSTEFLEPCDNKDIGTISENNVKWYELNADVGDSLVFKTNTPCILELYSSSGDKLLSLSGGETMSFNGVHTKEKGKHYLAVHDVKDLNNVLLNYALIDRYCVLDHTPTSSSKSDILVIKFIGNGLEELNSIELVSKDTVLNAYELDIQNYASATGKFNLLKYPKDFQKFNVRLIFGKNVADTILIEDGFTLQKMIKGKIVTEVLPSYRATTPYEVTIRITNTGNVPYWGIHFNIGLDKTGAGTAMEFKNFTPFVDDDLKDDIEIGYYVDNFLGTKSYGWYFPMILPYIGPNEVIDLVIGIIGKAGQIVNFYAWSGTPWSDEFQNYSTLNYRFRDYVDPNLNYITAGQLCLHKLLFLKDSLENEHMSRGTYVNNKAKCPSIDDELREAIDRIEYANELISEITEEEEVEKLLRSTFGDAVYEVVEELGDGNALIGLAELNASVAQSTGEAIGGIINGLRLRNSDPSLYGIDPSDETFSSLYEYRNKLRCNMPHPNSIIGRLFGEDCDLGERNCSNANPRPRPHEVTIYLDGDPNDIYGYKSESGSHYVGIDVSTLPYCIEFENSPEIANASANLIKVESILNPEIYDLTTFYPSTVTFGKYEIELNGEQDFVGTVDMRPDVNAIAEVRLSLNKTNGKMTCRIISLDPMTMEYTSYYKDGVLPVNYKNNEGIGTIKYTVALKKGLNDGTNINNSASIVFGSNAPIKTPVWHNVTDFVRPVSQVSNIEVISADEILLTLNGYDERSGIWKYNLYCSSDSCKTWKCIAEDLTKSEYIFKINNDTIYNFACVATDYAGNKEIKELQPEYTYYNGQIVSGIDNIPLRNIEDSPEIYNIQGLRVKSKLQSGVYIRGKRKIIISNTQNNIISNSCD